MDSGLVQCVEGKLRLLEGAMKGFIWGVVVTLGVGVVIAAAAYLYLDLGYFDFRADVAPSRIETDLATGFRDASVKRHTENLQNPISPTESNLREGLRLYLANCAGCHGSPSHPNRQFGRSFYPPVPNFFEEAPDMPDRDNYYIARYGVRLTGMPSWKTTLSDQEIWEIVTFLGRLDELPAAAQQAWEKPAGEAGD